MAKHWRRLVQQGNRKSAPRPQRRPRLRPAFERLEDRTVPASLVTLAYNDVTATPLVAQAFLTDLHQDVLFRPPDPGQLDTLSADLNSGRLTPGGAFANLVNSAEFKSFVSPVLTLYQ